MGQLDRPEGGKSPERMTFLQMETEHGSHQDEDGRPTQQVVSGAEAADGSALPVDRGQVPGHGSDTGGRARVCCPTSMRMTGPLC